MARRPTIADWALGYGLPLLGDVGVIKQKNPP
jgi:hypothetical protein